MLKKHLKGISMRTKLCFFNSNVKSVLLYGCETCWTTQTMQQKIRHSSTSVWGASKKSNGKRRSEMKIWGSERDRIQWPSRYCGASGAGMDTPSGSKHPAPHAKPWPTTLQGKRKRRWPWNNWNWRRDTEAELKQQGTNWSGMTRTAQNRVWWWGVVDGLCSTGSDKHK